VPTSCAVWSGAIENQARPRGTTQCVAGNRFHGDQNPCSKNGSPLVGERHSHRPTGSGASYGRAAIFVLTATVVLQWPTFLDLQVHAAERRDGPWRARPVARCHPAVVGLTSSGSGKGTVSPTEPCAGSADDKAGEPFSPLLFLRRSR
jgi:hypothetical protein